MGVRHVILGQLSLVFPGDFCQMVLPEFGLEQEIPGIGIVAENSFHGTLVEHTAALGGVFLQRSHTSAQCPVFRLPVGMRSAVPRKPHKARHGRDGVERAAGHSCISCICSDSDIFGCGSVVIAYH